MTTPEVARFGVKFPSRKERIVKRVTKCDTREIQKRLEPPKLAPVRAPPKRKPPPPKPKPVAPLVKTPIPHRDAPGRSHVRPPPVKPPKAPPARTLKLTDVEKLARLNCSREFSLFHQYIKSELSKAYENQLAFLQTKLQHLKNEFVNKQAEHLNFEQIKEYYQQAKKEHLARGIKPDEYLTLAEKFKQDAKQAIEKWIRKKDYKPPRQVNEYLKRRQERIRDRIKETIEEQKRQQLAQDNGQTTQSSITTSSASNNQRSTTATTVNDDDDDDDDDDITVID